MSRPPKARKISVFLAFPRFSAAVCFGKKLLTTDLTTYRFDRKIEYFHQSGCGAAGSARRLGACDRLVSRPPKAREISVFLAFPRFSAAVCFGKKLLTTDLTTYGFDRKIEYFHPSGCGAAGSARRLGRRCRRFEPCHSDQKSAENEVFAPLSAYFLLIIGFYSPPRQIRLTAETRLVP